MQVTSATQAGASTATANAKATSATPTLNYDAFLRLLMAQMQNQDPTNPTDSTQWVSQLATFSSVEQAIQTNAKLDQILASSSIGDAGALIGRTVTSADGQTSGVVVSITVSGGGSSANLADGSSIDLSSDIQIS
jgi:flagellar basal-body rod modification protein FlgD